MSKDKEDHSSVEYPPQDDPGEKSMLPPSELEESAFHNRSERLTTVPSRTHRIMAADH